MRPDSILVLVTLHDQHLGFDQGVDGLAIQDFFTQFTVEGVHVTILSRTADRGVGGLGSDGDTPSPSCGRQELRPVAH